MEAAVIGSVPMGGESAAPSVPAPIQRDPVGVPESRHGRARPGDFLSRMERSPEDDPSVTVRSREPNPIDDLAIQRENNELATVDPEMDPEPEAIEPEYTDPADVAKREFMDRLAEVLEQGRLPVDMLGQLLIEKTLPDGRKVDYTLAEIDRGFMRQSDYTRKLHESQQLAARAQHVLNIEGARNQSWQNDEVMMRDIINMGLADALDRMVMRYAKQAVEFRAKPPHEQQRVLLERQREQDRMRYEQRILQLEQRLNQPQQQNEQEEVTRHFNAQLAQMLPAAFKQHGLGVYPTARSTFLRNIEVLYEGGPCTRELVDAACQATREELENNAMLAAAAQAPRARTPGLPPRPRVGQTGPGIKPMQGNGRRARPSDFSQKFGQGF